MVSASDSGMAPSRCLKPRRLASLFPVTPLSLAFRPLILIPYGYHNLDGWPAHCGPFILHKGARLCPASYKPFSGSLWPPTSSRVHKKLSAYFYSPGLRLRLDANDALPWYSHSVIVKEPLQRRQFDLGRCQNDPYDYESLIFLHKRKLSLKY